MSGFAVSWLDRREPADHAARDQALLRAAARVCDDEPDALVVDIGCGTGSTARALGPGLGRPVRWRLVDHDPVLLAEAARRVGPGAETVVADLAALRALPVGGARLITASALFDLVSEAWLQRLIAAASAERAAVYAALIVDGHVRFDPVHPLDDPVMAAFHADMRRDKGFGPALGAAAATTAAVLFERAGYHVSLADSPWRLGAADAALTAAYVRGVADAVGERIGGEAADEWLDYRLRHAAEGAVVGHKDLLAVL